MAEGSQVQPEELISLTADIVSAYVGNNSMPAGDLPGFIGQIHAALQKTAGVSSEPAPQPLTPAVPVKKSVHPDYIVCLEDGKKFKSLKRHLRTEHNMTPEEYRQKWGLSRDYPMVAPNYGAARSELAKSMGLGQKRRSARAAEESAPAAPAARRRGRARKNGQT